MDKAHILIIDDDEVVGRTIQRSLEAGSFRASYAGRGPAGLDAARRLQPDLVILDVIMPGMDGYAVCRAMRSDPFLARIPVLFLTARRKAGERIQAFESGADDYLPKPFNIDELLLRVQAILRRTRQLSPPALQIQTEASRPVSTSHTPLKLQADWPRHLAVGPFVLDTRSFEIHTPTHGKVRLTPIQFDLLYHLMSHPGETFTPARLLDEVWDYPTEAGSPDLVRVHIKTLRGRVESDPQRPALIRTVPGRGYMVPKAVELEGGLV